jgi:hypothetical protein
MNLRIEMRTMFSFICLLIPLLAFGQKNNAVPANVQATFTADNRIKSIRLYKEGWNLSYPIIKFSSNEKLILHFDLLDEQPETYYYSFIHCDKDWNESGAFVSDYIEGFEENPLEDYEASFNTTVSYYHYSLAFPNDRIRLKLSGNYLIIIYLPGQRDRPVITRRFVVTEEVVKIDVNVRRPLMTKNNNTHQQLDFNVILTGTNLNDPYRNIFAAVLQNGRWDNARMNLKPDFYGGNELKYSSLSDKNIFPGGNEFRYFDIKSIRYNSEFVRSVDFAAPYYNVYLQPSENREFRPYFYWKDFNGKYFIAYQEGRDPEKDADYVYVYFTLPSREELPGGRMYVYGALSNWNADETNVMTYNREKRQYECAILLKQGWYNYEYVFMKDGEKNAVAGPFEGSHYETENDYLVLIYYRNPRERYDRVVGTAVKNTLNSISG